MLLGTFMLVIDRIYMLSPLQVVTLLTAFIALLVGYQWRHKQQLQQVLSQPLDYRCMVFLQQALPIYQKLTEPLKQNLHQLMKQFLHEKQFVGCAGLVITDEMKWITSAQACLLILNKPTTVYRSLKWIYIYPSSFFTERDNVDLAGVVSRQRHNLLGESWSNGKVILSWDDVKQGVQNFEDGHNVTLHEFAHQLDAESGRTNGAPLMYNAADYLSWAKILNKEFLQLQFDSQHGIHSVLSSYGATNPAEFFAVATEVFFEQPFALAHNHHELFEQLLHYYRVDPRQWK